MIAKDATTTIQPVLATAARQRSIQARSIEGQEIKAVKPKEPLKARHYTPEEIANAEKLIAGGQLKVVKGIQHSVVKINQHAPVIDNYFHGGDVFDDYTGKH